MKTAQHNTRADYWQGGNYELNLSFNTLNDSQWTAIIATLWNHDALFGPLSERFIPGDEPEEQIEVQVPPPTAALIQHGCIALDDLVVGCDVGATRSLFECVSVLIPVNMFEGVTGGPEMRAEHPEFEAVDALLYDIALRIYDVVPFMIAALGYERSCQLPSELQMDGELRHDFLVLGNFLAQDSILTTLEPDLAPYEEVRPGLRWMAPRE